MGGTTWVGLEICFTLNVFCHKTHNRTWQDVTSNMDNLETIFLEFPTGEPYPDTRILRILVVASWWARSIEIVGDTLALVTTCRQNPPQRQLVPLQPED